MSDHSGSDADAPFFTGINKTGGNLTTVHSARSDDPCSYLEQVIESAQQKEQTFRDENKDLKSKNNLLQKRLKVLEERCVTLEETINAEREQHNATLSKQTERCIT